VRNGSDTNIKEKKGYKTYITALPVLVGLVAAPPLFLWALDRAEPPMMHFVREATHLIYALLPALGAVVFGIAWSFCVFVKWNHWNVGIRVGLSIVIWALIAAVLASAFIGFMSCMISAGPLTELGVAA